MCILCEAGYLKEVFGSHGNDVYYNNSNMASKYHGGYGNDLIVNWAAGSELLGEGGSDRIYTYANNTHMDGGNGNDLLYSSGNNTTMLGGAGNDRLYNYGNNGYIEGGSGSDFIFNRGHDTTIDAGSGNDRIYNYDANNTKITGGDGADFIYNNNSNNATINSGNHNDVVYNSSSEDTSINAGEGNNFIRNYASEDAKIESGAGRDTVYNYYSANTDIDAGNGSNFVYNFRSENGSIETGSGYDRIFNYYSSNTDISAGDGYNYIQNYGSKDSTITTGDGTDFIYNYYSANTDIDAGNGNNYVNSYRSYNGSIETGSGYDRIYNYYSTETNINAGDGYNYIQNYASKNSTITTGDGTDFIYNYYSANTDIDAGNGSNYVNSYRSYNGSIETGSGYDRIYNYYSTETNINAGDGYNYIQNYASKNSTITTGDGTDFIYNYYSANTDIDAGNGSNYVNSYRSYNGSIETGSGYDRIYNYYSTETNINAGDGYNYIQNYASKNSTITTGDGTDFIYNYYSANTDIDAGNGNNLVTNSRSYNSSIDTGTGADHVYNYYSAKSTINTDAGNDYILNHGSHYTTVNTGEGNDYIRNNYSHYNTTHGGEGDDFIYNYRSYHVTFDGGAGNDIAYGSYGNDKAHYHYSENLNSNDYYHGNYGTDTLTLHITYNDLSNLAANANQLIDDFINAMKNSIVQNYNTDFNTFGFDLKAVSFESLHIEIIDPPQNPIDANDDAINLNEDDQQTQFDVFANDINTDDNANVIKVNGNTISNNGSIELDLGLLTLLQDGQFRFDSNDAYQNLAQGQEKNISYTYTVSDGITTDTATVNLIVQGSNDKATAKNDAFTVAEDGTLTTHNLFDDNGSGQDFDIDNGDTIQIHQFSHDNVNFVNAGQTITLDSGALLTVNADGTFVFDTNGQFGDLIANQNPQNFFYYNIKDQHGLVSDTAQAAVTIEGQDDDQNNQQPTLSVSDATVTEGSHGTSKYLTFTVSLSNTYSEDVTVDFTTAGHTASDLLNADFKAIDGQLTIASGDTSANIQIEVFGDNADENNETINLHLQNAVNATIADANATGTIIDNDTASTNALSAPILNSNINADHVFYLDFDGAVIQNTAWNAYRGISSINATAYDTDGNVNSFSATEIANIEDIFARVAEDFAPFNVNITTDTSVYEATAASNRLTSVITDYSSWYGSAGGVAYVNVFGRSNDYYQPAWVFSDRLGNGHEKYVAEAISHELGHNLGLWHDGTTTGASYYSGHGSGENGWAGIMGVGYYRNLTQWSQGEYANANQTQDDIGIIANHIGFRADDHVNYTNNANNFDDATLLHLGEAGSAGVGIIEQRGDTDIFTHVANGNVTYNISGLDKGTNLDIYAALYDTNNNLLAEAGRNDSSLNASLTVNFDTDTEVYLVVDGVGNGNDPSQGGYSDYGSLGMYSIGISVA